MATLNEPQPPIELRVAVLKAVHAIDCAPDCQELLTSCGRYGRYAAVTVDIVWRAAVEAERRRITLALVDYYNEPDHPMSIDTNAAFHLGAATAIATGAAVLPAEATE